MSCAKTNDSPAQSLHALNASLVDMGNRFRLIVNEVKAVKPDLHLSLPSNRVDTGPVALSAAANARQRSITLAPEAATQRMRDIICKTITDEMIVKIKPNRTEMRNP